MDRLTAIPDPDPALPWDYTEWGRLQGAMLRLQATAQATPRVLIVDDDPATRLLYALNLGLEGLLVLEASDGRTALARARAELPDLVLTDVTMPGLDGFQLAEELRADRHTRHIPIIFLSGETSDGLEERAHELGALAFLTKPVDVQALASLVAGVFAGSGAFRQPLPHDDPMPMSDSAA